MLRILLLDLEPEVDGEWELEETAFKEGSFYLVATKSTSCLWTLPPPPLAQAPPCLSTRTRSDRHFYRIF